MTLHPIAAALLLAAVPAAAHDGGIATPASTAVAADFDIVHTRISTSGNVATFHMAVSGKAGRTRPSASGKLAGSQVFSYVWPTTIDPWEVGFERKAGILALAVTAHPDFDDTPLFDENGDGRRDNDGDLWHSHWVVLQPNPACGNTMCKGSATVSFTCETALALSGVGVRATQRYPLILATPVVRASVTPERISVVSSILR